MRFLRRTLYAGALATFVLPVAQGAPPEAPAGFDNLTNGAISQAEFDSVREVFEEREFNADGLGPVFNAQACVECHQSPVTGGVSQITEVRAGRFSTRSGFQEHPGGSLIHDRAIDATMQEHVLRGNDVRAGRSSLNVLGDGFVEAIADSTLRAISQSQPSSMRGQVIEVPLLESPGNTRVGRFGWKNQHASLLSFSGDAYLNEMGITSPMFPVDNTSNGTVYDDGVADPEDDGADLDIFAAFMRATKAPPRDTALANTADARAGSSQFDAVGCGTCHVRNITTAPAGTLINGGTFAVPAAVGGKVIHPFSDFLLHDVGTGDGIVQNGPATTRNKLRTPPLWGLRTRSRLMHDGAQITIGDAVLRHGREASAVITRYRQLSETRRNQLLTFLLSL